MAVLKCKMCGGDLFLTEGSTVAECEYCGSKQTVPTADNEKKLNLFQRANRLRLACEFDKAAGVYESIVVEFPDEAEAYWGLVLCKYGIEYVDDPATGNKIPTCHRSSFESIMDDGDFELVMENADVAARYVYRDEALAIEKLRKGVIEVSAKEEPYDIFICYKETDADGGRTIDSVIAQDVYDELTEKGYRVFFSRVTLEDRLGQEYEPYIFAALNSAKIMLAFGTNYEYYNAVWVKNEWSRFLQLIAKGEKKTLIPCYKNIDAYDMPKEFAKLQAQDMGKVGAIQDLLRGIEKILPKKSTRQNVNRKETSGNSSTVVSLLKRVSIFLEDGNFDGADEYCEKVLDIDPECAEAYLGKLLVEYKEKSLETLFSGGILFALLHETDMKKLEFWNSGNYQKLRRFADAKLNDRVNESIYNLAQQAEKTNSKQILEYALKCYDLLGYYKDSAQRKKQHQFVNYKRQSAYERYLEKYPNAEQKQKLDSMRKNLQEKKNSYEKAKSLRGYMRFVLPLWGAIVLLTIIFDEAAESVLTEAGCGFNLIFFVIALIIFILKKKKLAEKEEVVELLERRVRVIEQIPDFNPDDYN